MEQNSDPSLSSDLSDIIQERDYYMEQVEILKAQLLQVGITPFACHAKSAPDLSGKRFSLPAYPDGKTTLPKAKRYSSCVEKSESDTSIQQLCISTYDKRSGTNDLGKQYEYVMCAFYAVRFATSEDVEDFEMTTNDEVYGDFDDIALKVHYTNGTTHTYLFQLKHTENKKSLTENILSAEKNDFGLMKYLKTFQNLSDHNNLSCILFTNRKALLKQLSRFSLNNIGLVVKKFDDVTYDPLLDTNQSTKKSVFQLGVVDDSAEMSSFFDHFYLFANQSGVSKVKVTIEKLLLQLLECDVCDGFINYMKNWWGGNFILTKSDVIAKLAELALSPMATTISSKKESGRSRVLREAMLGFDMVLVEGDDSDVVGQIWGVTAEVRDVSLTALKYGVVTKGVGSIEELTQEQRGRVLWYLNKAPLVVRVQDPKRGQVERAVAMLERVPVRKKLLLVGKFSKEEFPHWRVFESLADLQGGSLYEDVVHNFELSLQGRGSIPLQALIKSTEKASIIKVGELVEMTQSPLLIGEERSDLPESYIPRMVTTTFLDTEKVLHHCTTSNDLVIVIVSSHLRLELTGFRHEKLEDYSGNPDVSVLLTSSCSKSLFDRVCNQTPKFRVHLLKLIDDDSSILVLSTDNTLKSDELRAQKPPLHEDDIHKVFDTPINVLCAQPGIGKSTMIKYLHDTCPPDHWSVRINLRKFNSLLKDEPEEEEILLHFLELGHARSLLQQVKALFVESRKIYLFLDGLDEIESNCVDFALDYVNYIAATGVHVWISSRMNLQDAITMRLNVFPIDILELSQEQQREYIQQRLECRYGSGEIAEIADKVFQSADVANSHNMLGTPLQLYIITENFLNDVQLYRKLTKEVFVLTNMYKQFFDGKKKHLYEKVGVQYDQQLGFSFNLYLENYELPGLRCCLDDETFRKLDLDVSKSSDFLEMLKSDGDKFGIISHVNDDRAVFTHQTYAEYFACLWLKKNFVKARLLKTEFQSEKYQNLRLIFDIMLAENSPLHLAVIYQNCEQVRRHLGDVGKDLGGRYPLHLLCSYGRKYVPLKVVRSLYSNQLFHQGNHLSGESSNYLEIFSMLLQSESERDEVFEWTPIEYALHFHCLYPVERFLQLQDEVSIDGLCDHMSGVSMVYYSAKFGYPSLLEAVLKKNLHVVHFRIGEDKMSFLHVVVKGVAEEEECRLRSWDNTIKVVHILVKSGLDVNVRDRSGATPLHWAVAQGRYDLVKALLDEGADVNAVDKKEETVVHYGLHGWEHQVKLFKMDRVPDGGIRDPGGGTLLHWASHEGDYNLVETFSDTTVCNSILETPLHHAVRAWHPNLEIVSFLIDHGVDVNSRDIFGTTPLHWALHHGHYALMGLLHQKGAQITTLSPEHQTTLRRCYKPLQPNMHVLEMLIERGFNVNSRTILHWVSQKGHVDTVNLLLTNGATLNETILHSVSCGWNAHLVTIFTRLGADVNTQDPHGVTPLHLAAQHGHLRMAQTLIEQGAHTTTTTNTGETALTFAVKSPQPNLDLTLLLLRRGININSKDTDGVTALHWACQCGHLQVVQTLLDHGADVNATTNQLEKPLHYTTPSCDIISMLLQRGADVNAADATGTTALHWAAERGQFDIVNLLLGAGADVNAVTKRKETPLIYATKQRKVCLKVAKLLVAADADVATTDCDGMNSLHWACDGGHYDIVKLLIDKVDVKKCSHNGRTTLHHAAKNWMPNTEVVNRLVAAGVDINSRDDGGATPLHLACKEGHFNNVDLLLRLGADPFCVTTHRETTLHFAAKAWKNNDVVLQLLVDKGVDVNAVDDEGKTALHRASQNGFYDNVKLLVDTGATVDAVTPTKLTSLHFAVYGGHTNVVKLLLENGFDIDKAETKDVPLPLYFALRNGRLKLELLLVMAATIRDKFPLLYQKRYSHQEVVTYLQEAQTYMETKSAASEKSATFRRWCRKTAGRSASWVVDIVRVFVCRQGLEGPRTPTFIVHYPVFTASGKGASVETDRISIS